MAYTVTEESMRLPHQVDLTDDVTNMSFHFPSFNLPNLAEKIHMENTKEMVELKMKQQEKDIDLELKKRIHERLLACIDSNDMEKAFKIKKLLGDGNLFDSPKKPEVTSKKIEDDDVIIIENDIEIKPIVTVNDIIVKTESRSINKRQARFSHSSRKRFSKILLLQERPMCSEETS